MKDFIYLFLYFLLFNVTTKPLLFLQKTTAAQPNVRERAHLSVPSFCGKGEDRERREGVSESRLMDVVSRDLTTRALRENSFSSLMCGSLPICLVFEL